MKIETLKEFIVYARYLSFSRAAEELYISQPSLSLHLRALEKEIGFTLIKRGYTSSLTPAGKIFLERSQELLDIYHLALAEGCSIANTSPAARIFDSKEYLRLHYLISLAQDIPHVLVPIHGTRPLWNAIAENVVDMGVCPDYTVVDLLCDTIPQLGLSCFPVEKSLLGICVMDHHPLAKSASVSRSDLSKFPVVISSRAYYDIWQGLLTKLIEPALPLRFRLSPFSGLTGLASYDFGDSLYVNVLDILQSFMHKRKDIVLFKEIDGVPLETRFLMLYNKQSTNPNVHSFAEKVRSGIS